MKNIIILLALFIFSVSAFACSKNEPVNKPNNKNTTDMKSSDTINISSISVKKMDGSSVSIGDYKGKVLLIVNVASRCGYTPQYEALERIYEKYKDRGFEILAFPCNDFGGQEPGTNEEIVQFCKMNYNVTFTLFDKIRVLGEEKSPLYKELIKFAPADDIGWNFEKFLVDKTGNVVGRFKSKVKPDSEEITSLIESELAK